MIQVLVGATVPERDITEVIDGLAYSSANPGGFASCNFTIPGRALYRYVNQLRTDARVWVKRGARTLWEGYVVNDPEAVKFGDSADVVVECAGLLERAKRRRDYCKTWVDLDYDQWFTLSDMAYFTSHNDGFLNMTSPEGTTVPAGMGRAWYYWIDSGLGDDDIDHLVISGPFDRGTGFDGKVQTSPSPWDAAGWTDSDLLLSDESSPLDMYRDPNSGSYPAGTKAVRVRFYSPSGTTTTADRYWNVYCAVYGASYPGTAEIADYMVECANDIASTTTDGTVGTATAYAGTAAVRPFGTHAEALDYLGSLHSSPLEWGFWEDDSFAVAVRDTAPAARDHLIVDASDAGVSWDVERIAEEACEAVCVLYATTDHATHPDGTVLSTYRASEPASAEARVHVLDYSETYMSAAEAASVGDQYLDYMSSAQYEGTVTVTGRCKRVDGVPVPATDMRAGMSVENLDEPGHGPRYVSFCDYSRDTDTATLTIGDPRKEFMLPSPGGPATSPNIIFKRIG